MKHVRKKEKCSICIKKYHIMILLLCLYHYIIIVVDYVTHILCNIIIYIVYNLW